MGRVRRTRLSLWSWWPWHRPRHAPRHAVTISAPRSSTGVGISWATAQTQKLPVLNAAPLMTRAQQYRGNGGRWAA